MGKNITETWWIEIIKMVVGYMMNYTNSTGRMGLLNQGVDNRVGNGEDIVGRQNTQPGKTKTILYRGTGI